MVQRCVLLDPILLLEARNLPNTEGRGVGPAIPERPRKRKILGFGTVYIPTSSKRGFETLNLNAYTTRPKPRTDPCSCAVVFDDACKYTRNFQVQGSGSQGFQALQIPSFRVQGSGFSSGFGFSRARGLRLSALRVHCSMLGQGFPWAAKLRGLLPVFWWHCSAAR